MSAYDSYTDAAIELTAGSYRYAIIASRFNAFVVDKLQQAAIETLQQHGAKTEQIQVLQVPGAFEIPYACQLVAQTGKYAAIIALGCIIRGETPHFDYVCSESARGIMEVGLKYNLPVVYGILTTDDVVQAEARAGGPAGNKGAAAAKVAMEMLGLTQQLL